MVDWYVRTRIVSNVFAGSPAASLWIAMACSVVDVGKDESKCDFFDPVYNFEGLLIHYSFEKMCDSSFLLR